MPKCNDQTLLEGARRDGERGGALTPFTCDVTVHLLTFPFRNHLRMAKMTSWLQVSMCRVF